MKELILIVSIIVAIIPSAVYMRKVIKRNNRIIDFRNRNEDNIINSLQIWRDSDDDIIKINKEELFSPKKMKNGEVDRKNLEVKYIDYSKNTPWFFRI